MATVFLEFDPTSEDPANSSLSIWNNSGYAVTAFNPDAANQAVQWASSVDTEGALPASVKDENRTISMTVECLSASALRGLQAKAAKIGRERGTLKYTLPAGGEVVVFDLLTRESFKPEFDVKYFINEGAYCTVSLSFTAKPYGRGASTSLTLTPSTSTANQPLVAEATGIRGDVFATGSLAVTNNTNYRSYLKWGVQSRYYSIASTAALFLEAESGTAIGAALHAGPANTSGSGGNKAMRHATVSTLGSRSYRITASGSALTHVGDFNVIARVQADSANTGTVSVRLRWALQNVTTSTSIAAPTPYTDNDWVPLENDGGTPQEGAWLLVNLGMVSIRRKRIGTHAWTAELWAKSTVAADVVSFDWVTLVPVSEGSGELRHAATIAPTGSVTVSDSDSLVTYSTETVDGQIYEGDYFKVPPTWWEGRTLRLVSLLAGSSTGGIYQDGAVVAASTLEAVAHTVTYTPRYLVVPEP